MDYDTALLTDEDMLTYDAELQSEEEPPQDQELTEATEQGVEYTETTESPVIPSRPFLTTAFEDYTVTEGLLLIIVFLLVVRFMINTVKGGFTWLR